MGVFPDKDSHTSTVDPDKLYNALTKHFKTIITKMMNTVIKSVEGSGSPGSTLKITFEDEGKTPVLGYKLDKVDDQHKDYEYTFLVEEIKGLENIEKVGFKTRVSRNAGGGSDVNITINYYTKDDVDVPEETRDELKAKASGFFWAIELLAKATQA
ncbi:hypothetical protein RJT34_17950 [Clitoria ternatea]|uniref:Bet v I/Major latex protein domain-containing protein n=1 Tax=Clitoria ternatea TaxID=43366 RepID=A0AAN9J9W9_CLITE